MSADSGLGHEHDTERRQYSHHQREVGRETLADKVNNISAGCLQWTRAACKTLLEYADRADTLECNNGERKLSFEKFTLVVQTVPLAQALCTATSSQWTKCLA